MLLPSRAPAVSVVVPVLNAGPLVREQLLALQGQRFAQTWEIILVDNGCTDGCLDGLAGDEAGPLVRVVDARDRPGAAHARNVGARLARGEWLAFCDADDIVAAEWLDSFYAARALFDVLTGAIDFTRLNNPEVSKAVSSTGMMDELPVGPGRFLPCALSGNLFLRRAAFLDAGGFDESLPYTEDTEFSWRVQLAGRTLGMEPRAVVHVRCRDSVLAAYRQQRNYARFEVLLYRRYRCQGARRLSLHHTLHSWWWIASRVPFSVMRLSRRYVWFKCLGQSVGRLDGSLRYRVWYP